MHYQSPSTVIKNDGKDVVRGCQALPCWLVAAFLIATWLLLVNVLGRGQVLVAVTTWKKPHRLSWWICWCESRTSWRVPDAFSLAIYRHQKCWKRCGAWLPGSALLAEGLPSLGPLFSANWGRWIWLFLENAALFGIYEATHHDTDLTLDGERVVHYTGKTRHSNKVMSQNGRESKRVINSYTQENFENVARYSIKRGVNMAF